MSGEWLILWIAGFTCLALFDLTTGTLAIIFWLGVVGLTFGGIKKFNLPTEKDIQARLEQDSRILHRPLRSQEDVPATTLSARSDRLWRLELSRKYKQLSFLAWITPTLSLVRRDPYAVRIALILLLFIGGVISGGAAPAKISGAFFPFSFMQPKVADTDLQIVITPPSYTRKPQITLSGTPKEIVTVYQGSKIRVIKRSDLGNLQLVMGDESLPLHYEEDTDVISIETSIPETKTIKLTQFGFPVLSIPVQYIKDQSPSLTLRGQIEVMPGGQLVLPLSVQDDYGLKLVRVRAMLSSSLKRQPLGEPVFEEKTIISSTSDKPVEINPRFDLTGHTWAGYPVSLLIEGEDHAEQTVSLEPIEIILPERRFRHPVAKEIVSARAFLIKNGEVAAGATALNLAEILARPQLYNWDEKITLALRSAMSRLAYDPSQIAAQSVTETLWQAALRLEDGNLTSSQTAMRDALEDLQRAIQEKKSPEEIERLLGAFFEALSKHLQNIQMAQKKADPLPSGMTMEMFDPAMLKDFLSQLAEDLMKGDGQSAMEKLEALQKMTDMMDSSLAQPMPEDIKEMMKTVQGLQKIIDQQQALLNQTRNLGNKNSQTESKQQGKIKKGVTDISSQLEKSGSPAPEPLKNSSVYMEQSEAELTANNPNQSEPHQQKALDELRKGKKSMQQELQNRLQKMMGLSIGGMQENRDPLGQKSGPNGKDILNSTVKLPTGAERKKADEILKSIREKSSDLSRPQAEREYYQRLLRQW